jgi:hypothetical protein
MRVTFAAQTTPRNHPLACLAKIDILPVTQKKAAPKTFGAALG